MAVMLLGAIYPTDTQADVNMVIGGFETTVELGGAYLRSLPTYMLEVAMALLPIFVFFLLFQVFSLRLRRLPLTKIVMGVGYTFLGLVLFLTGVNVGFSPLGYVLGKELVTSGLSALLIPLAMLMGWFIIDAEPAVHILNKQVEELTSGAISAKAMGLSLSVAVALANGLAMVRVLTGLPILYFLLPGYAVALGLSFFVPRTFTAIAFDSGGVASGPLTATFMLPLAMGACTALGGNVMTDAFGLVALVAMMPLITVQVMGGIYVLKSRTKTDAPCCRASAKTKLSSFGRRFDGALLSDYNLRPRPGRDAVRDLSCRGDRHGADQARKRHCNGRTAFVLWTGRDGKGGRQHRGRCRTDPADFQGGEAEALYRHPRKRRDDGNSAQKRGWWQDAGLFDRFYTDRRKTRDGFFA